VKQVLSKASDLSVQSDFLVSSVQKRKEWQMAKVVAMYLPLRDEPNIDKLILQGQRNGKIICVPKYYPTGEMIFVKLQTALDDLPTDRYGIRTEESNDTVEQFELMIVPGRAFTSCGKRLGRGGGYYDRYLEKNNCPKIALAFYQQIFEDIPTEEHDQKVDLVIFKEK